jgi:DNA repair protein RAD16
VKPINPEKAAQPENLNVTLLPFQQESLFWMRKQEQGVWKGGLLAVSVFSSSASCLV